MKSTCRFNSVRFDRPVGQRVVGWGCLASGSVRSFRSVVMANKKPNKIKTKHKPRIPAAAARGRPRRPPTRARPRRRPRSVVLFGVVDDLESGWAIQTRHRPSHHIETNTHEHTPRTLLQPQRPQAGEGPPLQERGGQRGPHPGGDVRVVGLAGPAGPQGVGGTPGGACCGFVCVGGCGVGK